MGSPNRARPYGTTISLPCPVMSGAFLKGVEAPLEELSGEVGVNSSQGFFSTEPRGRLESNPQTSKRARSLSPSLCVSLEQREYAADGLWHEAPILTTTGNTT